MPRQFSYYTNLKKQWTKSLNIEKRRPGQFYRIVGNAGNHGHDGKFHKNHQILNQTKRYVNKLCLGKISRYETVRIKFSMDSGFSNKPYDKKRTILALITRKINFKLQ